MELLDSYLRAVKRYLPRAQRNDIVAELSVELRSQMESREDELGRPLSIFRGALSWMWGYLLISARWSMPGIACRTCAGWFVTRPTTPVTRES
jgi:hypothetical protein